MESIKIVNRPELNDVVWAAKDAHKPVVLQLHLRIDGTDQSDWLVASTDWVGIKDALLILRRESDDSQQLRLKVRITAQSAVVVDFVQ